MEVSEVLALVDELDGNGVAYWLDGGWGVDCLLREQTRPHSDLDLVLHREHVGAVKDLLTARGYEVIRDWLPTALAFRGPADAKWTCTRWTPRMTAVVIKSWRTAHTGTTARR